MRKINQVNNSLENELHKEILIEKRIIAHSDKNSMMLRTQNVKIGDISLIKDGKICTIEPKLPEIDEVTVDTLITESTTEQATTPVTTGTIIEIPKSAPKETLELSLTSQEISNILKEISFWFSDSFTVIPSNRDRTFITQGIGKRAPIFDDTILAEIQSMCQIVKASERKERYTTLKKDVAKVCHDIETFDAPSGQLHLSEKGHLDLPIAYVGSGHQEILQMMYRILKIIKEDPMGVIAIEEPENHLHPDLARRLFYYLRTLSQENQIIITTHSPFFMDRSSLDEIWQIKRTTNKGSTIERIGEISDFRNILYDIGIKPSDVLLADAILLVEGKTEEFCLPILASKIGFDISQIAIISQTQGSPQHKYHLNMWQKITKDTNVPVFLHLDSHAKSNVEDLIHKGVIKREMCFISDHHSIEEWYPKSLIINGIKELFDAEIEEKNLPNGEVAKNIGIILKKKKKIINKNSWKIPIARYICSKIKKDEIPHVIQQLIISISHIAKN